ncbi:MAG: type IX secretion system sortase PorU [Bacteroidota bacterium]
MKRTGKTLLCLGLLTASFCGLAQRNYAPASVLSGGNWYKLGVKNPGVYKIDVPLLNTMGINTANLASSSVRLYGNGGQMLAEANNGTWTDDLKENAVQVVDGGDGVINGADYILFYANGPDEWMKDSVNQSFHHRKNIYSDKAYYFLTVGGAGKRISNAPLLASPVTTVNSFSERYFHELDTVNFLSSGKEWYGEEMSDLPGRSLTRNFSVSFPNALSGAQLQMRANCVARSVNIGSRFDVRINNQAAGQVPVNATGSGQYDPFAQQAVVLLNLAGVQVNNSISFTYVPGNINSQGWLNWFELFSRRTISLNGINQLLFRDWPSVGSSRVEYVVANAGAGTQVWEITDPLNPQLMPGSLVNNEFRFVNDAIRLREYIAFNPADFLIPAPEGVVAIQNLHNTSPADYLIITFHSLLPQAQRLADIHRQRNGLKVRLVTTAQVYNEFASGSPDPAAIRDFVKMYWDKYGAAGDKPRYLLLFGDASFDYKERLINNTNLVPAYQNNFSLDPLSTYTSDDFFGFLDDQEDINSIVITNLLDIGIGRIPAKNAEEAKNYVDKLEAYYSAQSLGSWRNNLTFIADDEDNNLHLQDAEIITGTAGSAGPVFNQQKIYLDAFRQESSPGGSRYPQANQASNNQVYNGTLIWNYNGHGGPRRLAEETVLDQETVNNWNNSTRLPLFITATCDFAPYDNPTASSLGENILLRPKTGGIALMTTTRPVFAFSNRVMTNNYLQFALQPDPSGGYKTLGEAVKKAKNYTYQTLGDIANNRKFTLLGDPALALAFPSLQVRTTGVNGLPAAQTDTISSAEAVTINGEVTDVQGSVITSFNGTVYPVVFDKPQVLTTLANDPGSQPANFRSQVNMLFKGRATVSGGKFSFTFRVPKDINYQFGNGKLSFYAENGTTDANGYFTNFIVGGAGIDNGGDREGPEIRPFLNDELFVNGGLCNETPVLIVKLTDSSGINTAATGIGHDIVATLDNNNRQFFILNDFYQGDLNSYQRGTVRFQLPELPPGPHSLKIKAWDVLNNSNEMGLDFVVAKDEELELSHVLNYPNPFINNTAFWFEHNKPGQPLQVLIQIMTISGRVVKSISRTVLTEGNRSDNIEWDGRDDYGDKLGRGVYLYRLRVTGPERKKKEVLEKLVIF